MTVVSATQPPPTPLPEKLALLVHEARWLLVGLAGVYLALVLWGFDRADPGWSHSAAVDRIANPGGRVGAWLSDLLLYLFGLSAWWWVVLPFFLVAWGYHRLSHLFGGDRRPLLIALTGFLVLLLASCGLEAMRFWSLKVALPMEPGGMLGFEVGRLFALFLGYTGGTLILLVLGMIGFSLFTGLSWITAAEKTGILIEGACLGLRSLWEGWQDRRYGRTVAEQREEVVETERRKVEESPVRIEPVEIVVPVAPKAVARAAKERQAPLFFDAPGGALPPLHLLAEPSHDPADLPAAETLEFTSRLIERKLADFNVEAKVLTAHPGPVVTRYEIEPAVGVKGSQIVNLAKDLARALSLVSIRVVETVPGKSCMALELPNPRRQIVRLSEIIGSQAYHGMHSPLSMAMGKDIGGQPVVVDLAKMPHLLVAGTTGSGKSVGVNAMILSLIYKSEPKDVRMIMVDPKMLELSIYEGIPHLLAPVVTDMTKAANALHWCVGEMERRYKLMSALGVRNLSGFNSKINEAKKAGEHIPNPFSLTANTEIGPEPLQPHALHRGGDRRTGRPDDGGRQEDRGTHRAPGAEGPRLGHPPDPRHAAAQRRCDHRPDQGQHPDPHRLPGVIEDRFAHHPRPDGRRGAARPGRHAVPGAGHRPAGARAWRLRRRRGGASRGRPPEEGRAAGLRRGPARRAGRRRCRSRRW
jgi:S-DNA-T family DNA segregation ATPase FtsK/SpoIIIE